MNRDQQVAQPSGVAHCFSFLTCFSGKKKRPEARNATTNDIRSDPIRIEANPFPEEINHEENGDISEAGSAFDQLRLGAQPAPSSLMN